LTAKAPEPEAAAPADVGATIESVHLASRRMGPLREIPADARTKVLRILGRAQGELAAATVAAADRDASIAGFHVEICRELLRVLSDALDVDAPKEGEE
jgi:hypothetical protein